MSENKYLEKIAKWSEVRPGIQYHNESGVIRISDKSSYDRLHRDQKNSGIRRGALTSGGILGAAGAGLGAVIGGGVMPSKTKMGLKLGLAGAAVGAVSGGLSKLKRYNSHPELVDRDAINSIHRSAGHKDRTYAHVPGGSAEKSLDAILNHLPPKK